MTIPIIVLTWLTMAFYALAGLSIVAYLEGVYILAVVFGVIALVPLYLVIRICVDIYRWMNPKY